MRIVAAQLHRYAIPLRRTFANARGGLSRREGFIVELVDDAGRRGRGDIAPLAGFGAGSLDEAEAAARRCCADLPGLDIAEPAAGLDALRGRLPDLEHAPASTRCGLDTALLELAAEAARTPLARLLRADAADAVAYNSLLPADATRREIEAACPPGVGVVKVKVGAGAPEDDRRRIEALLDGLPPGVRLRLDANGVWTPEQALTALVGLPAARIDYVEEPLAPRYTEALDDLHHRCGLVFALDETASDTDRWRALLQLEAIGAVVLKPTLVGGLSAAVALADVARRRGKTVVVTTCFESGIGVAACLHLAAAVAGGPDGGAPTACGLDTLRLLEDTLLVDELRTAGGAIRVPAAPGLGVRLDRDSACLETAVWRAGDSHD